MNTHIVTHTHTSTSISTVFHNRYMKTFKTFTVPFVLQKLAYLKEHTSKPCSKVLKYNPATRKLAVFEVVAGEEQEGGEEGGGGAVSSSTDSNSDEERPEGEGGRGAGNSDGEGEEAGPTQAG